MFVRLVWFGHRAHGYDEVLHIFLVIQFPLADARGFFADGAGRLLRPSWPLAQPHRDFVRSAGCVQTRRRGGVETWAGEDLYSDASAALRFSVSSGDVRSLGRIDGGKLRCSFRRFFSDGIVARFELGLRVSRPIGNETIDLQRLLTQVLELPVRVGTGANQTRQIRLVDAGSSLAHHFLIATSKHLPDRAEPRASWHLVSGMPMMLVEHDQRVLLPRHTRHVPRSSAFETSLSHLKLQLTDRRCNIWFIGQRPDVGDQLRRLRIHLSRLHAERECLRITISHLRHPNRFDLARDSYTSEAVQEYLRDKVRLVQRSRYLGVDRGGMLAVACDAVESASLGEGASLNFARRQVALLVKRYLRESSDTAAVISQIKGNVMLTRINIGDMTVSGDFSLSTAENIQNSFNKAAAVAHAQLELGEALKRLTEAVAALAARLPQSAAEALSKDMEILIREATSQQPRRRWWELSAQGIVEAAQSVSDLTQSVIKALRLVVELLPR